MKKLTLFFLLFPLFGLAQNSILYEVSKPGQQVKSYLMGTIHVQDEKAFNFNDSVFWAIDQCSKTAFELDLSLAALKKIDEDIITEIIDTHYIAQLGKYLEKEFIPQLVREVPAKDLANKITVQILPAYIEIMKMKFSANNRSHFVDQYLQNYARKNKKEIIGIETYVEQFQAILGNISSFDYEKADLSTKMIEYIKKDDVNLNMMKMFSGTDQMINYYHNGDLQGLCEYLTSSIASTNAFTTNLYQRIFFDRNDLMFERTKDKMAEGGMFVAVGSGHLCGSNGLIEQYENAGFVVRAINITSASNRPIEWKQTESMHYTVEVPKNAGLSVQGANQNMGMGFAIQSLIDSTFENTLFTAKGMATFKIERTDYSESSEETDEFDYAKFLQELQEIQDSTQAENELDYVEEIEYTDDIEYTDEIDGEKVYEVYEVDEPASYDDLEIEISPSDGEYSDEEIYDAEMEEYSEVENNEETKDNGFPFSKNSVKKKLTEEQQAYFKEVGDSLSGYIKKEMGTLMMSMMGMGSKKGETYEAIVNNEEVELDFNRTILGSSISTTIETETSEYVLTIEGDPEILQSEEIRRFFTSFKLKE